MSEQQIRDLFAWIAVDGDQKSAGIIDLSLVVLRAARHFVVPAL